MNAMTFVWPLFALAVAEPARVSRQMFEKGGRVPGPEMLGMLKPAAEIFSSFTRDMTLSD